MQTIEGSSTSTEMHDESKLITIFHAASLHQSLKNKCRYENGLQNLREQFLFPSYRYCRRSHDWSILCNAVNAALHFQYNSCSPWRNNFTGGRGLLLKTWPLTGTYRDVCDIIVRFSLSGQNLDTVYCGVCAHRSQLMMLPYADLTIVMALLGTWIMAICRRLISEAHA